MDRRNVLIGDLVKSYAKLQALRDTFALRDFVDEEVVAFDADEFASEALDAE